MSLCPGCGRCDKCGRNPSPRYPVYPAPYPYWQVPGWSNPTYTGTSPDTSGITVTC